MISAEAWELPPMPPSRTRRIISTLCPKRLVPSDLIDISGRVKPTLTLPSCGKSYIWYGLDPPKRIYVGFPPNTRGFLYYHTPPKAPPLVGELRFRLASDLDGFHDGQDLLAANKTPWSVSLHALANRIGHLKLRDKLLLDGLVSQTTVDKWADDELSLLHVCHAVGLNHPVLYYLRQPFYHRFNAINIGFYAATGERIARCATLSYFRDFQFKNAIIYPYGGSGMVQFEPYEGRLAVRVLKILEPVQDLVEGYKGFIHRPVEGELVQRSHATGVVTRPMAESVKELTSFPVHFEDLP